MHSASRISGWRRKLFAPGSNGRFFRKSLILVLLIASLPGLLIGTGVYFIGMRQMTNELSAIHLKQLKQAQRSIDTQLSSLESSLSHWAFNPQFDDKLRQLDIIYGYGQVQDIYKTLLVMRELNPLIQQVVLYLDEPQPRLFTERGYERISGERYEKYKELLNRRQSTQWLEFAAEPADGAGGAVPLLLVHNIPGGSSRPFGAFLVTLDPEKLEDVITLLTPRGEGTSFLIERSGQWIAPVAPNGGVRALDEALRARVLEEAAEEATFVFDWENELYSVSYGTMNRLGTSWMYVSATPMSALTRPVVFTSRLIIGLSVFALLLAAVLSWLASRRLYHPVARLAKLVGRSANGRADGKDGADEFEMMEDVWHRVMKERQSLEAQLKRQLPQVKEGFLLQLAQGYLAHLSEADLRERMESLGWHARDRRFAVIYIQLLGITELRGRFFEGDDMLVTFAAANIAQELAGEAAERAGGQASVINFHDLASGLLIASPAEEPEEAWRERTSQLLRDIRSRVNALLKIRVAISLGAPVDRLSEIPGMLEQTRQALRYRNVRDDNPILDVRQTEKEGGEEAIYPFHLEREVLEGIREGDEEAAVAAVRRFMQELRTNSGKELWVQQGMLHLLGNVLHAAMQMGTSVYELYDHANLYEQLCQLREPDEIEGWFAAKVVAPMMREAMRKEDVMIRQLVENVVETIKERYMDDISLEYFADAHRLGPYALSRMFKQVTGVNFIDYLTEIRMEKARELLRHSSLKLNEVAERVGYRQSYFSRIFKKHVGVTPSVFRENSRSKEDGQGE